MKTSRVVILLLISSLGCTKQNRNSSDNTSPDSGIGRAKRVKEACLTSPCEGEAFMRKLDMPNGPNLQKWQKTPLRPDEVNSLKAAMANTETNGDEGKLVFRGDQDHDAHVSGNEPEVSLGNQTPATNSKPVKILATPAALRMLQERVPPPPQ
jgi:hypothetical protein